MKSLAAIVLLVLLMVLFTGAANADPFARASLKPFIPGEDIDLEVIIKGQGNSGTTYDLQIHYNGAWWGGGCGPAHSDYGNQYWMECHYIYGCTEWWRGEIPGHDRDTITIPLTTNPYWSGDKYLEAITIKGAVNGQPIDLLVTVKSKTE